MIYIKLFIYFTVFYLPGAQSYILNKTENGGNIKWPNSSNKIQFYINGQNINNVSNQDVNFITEASTLEWDRAFSREIGLITTTTPEREGRNDVYFASQDSLFNDSGIIGVTQLIFDIDSGDIVETDIILNDIGYNLSSTQGAEYYLGDVLTHEFGHALGLGHGQVFGSTMFYRLRNGQSSVEQDDISGLGVLYGHVNHGVITGKVIGGADLKNVFGVKVSAISENFGSIVASTVSKANGSFDISGLPTNDTYFLYIEPLHALSTLPLYFQERKINFCQSGSNFRGSFYQGCNSRDSGFPHGVFLSGEKSHYDVGNVSIRCSLSVSNDYLINKSGGVNNLKLDHLTSGITNIGQALTGYFSTTEIINNSYDEFDVKLEQIDFSSLSADGDYFLEIKTISQKIFSKIKLEMQVLRSDNSLYIYPANNDAIYVDSELNPDIDIIMRVPLSRDNGSLNNYNIKITPYDVNSYAHISFQNMSTLYPSLDDFLDSEAFYLLSVRVVERVLDTLGGESYKLVTHREYAEIQDNTLCPDAPETYEVLAGGYAERAEEINEIRKKSNSGLPIACGSINFPDDNDPNMKILSLCFSLFILIGLSQLTKFV